MRSTSESPEVVELVQSRKPVKNRERKIGGYRLAVQLAMAALCIWIGIEFHFFVKYLESGGTADFVSRPPGAEGFLPISSLMSLYYYFLTGVVHQAHPAGMFILIAILAISLVFGKSFCSWLCPVGFLSEMLGDLSEKLLGRKLSFPRWLDFPLRSIKYLLLAFFVYSIFFLMSASALGNFLSSPYNIMADVKMYYFFADVTRFALIVLGVLFALSFLIRNFWCRYLCPYGALLGVFSLISPSRIKRNAASCIDCGKCAKVCPSLIKVDQVRTVVSDECTSCLKCLDTCPVADTLELRTVAGGRKIDKRWVPIVVVVGFLLITGLGMVSGNWYGRTTREEYLLLQPEVHVLGHPTGSKDIRLLNEASESDAEKVGD